MPQRGDAYEFIEGMDVSAFWTEEEKLEASDRLQLVLDTIGPGSGRYWYLNNDDFDSFMEYTGLDYDSPLFWEGFREWYGDT